MYNNTKNEKCIKSTGLCLTQFFIRSRRLAVKLENKLVWFSGCSTIPKMIIALVRRKEETPIICIEKQSFCLIVVVVLVVDDQNTIRSVSQ